MRISIRQETAEDIAAIHSLTEEAFRDVEHSSHTEQYINDALRNSGQLTLSLVAVEQEKVVGHVAISPVTLSDTTSDWYGLGPVAVSPTRQCEGIGSLLIRRALEMTREKGAHGCVVLGEPEYYGRFGFKARSSLVLPGVPAEYFQALVFVGPMPTATVLYHDAFNASGPDLGVFATD
jgi:predicted N-acetyltransferase YhbS